VATLPAIYPRTVEDSQREGSPLFPGKQAAEESSDVESDKRCETVGIFPLRTRNRSAEIMFVTPRKDSPSVSEPKNL
jgi:hypothetical protein